MPREWRFVSRGRAALCFLNGTCPFCKQKGRLPPPRGQCIKMTPALLFHLYIEDARWSGEAVYLAHILDQQAQVMLPADRPERPQIKGVCSDLRKCHGCQTQEDVISLSGFSYLATLSARVISPCTSPWQRRVWSRRVGCIVVVIPGTF